MMLHPATSCDRRRAPRAEGSSRAVRRGKGRLGAPARTSSIRVQIQHTVIMRLYYNKNIPPLLAPATEHDVAASTQSNLVYCLPFLRRSTRG